MRQFLTNIYRIEWIRLEFPLDNNWPNISQVRTWVSVNLQKNPKIDVEFSWIRVFNWVLYALSIITDNAHLKFVLNPVNNLSIEQSQPDWKAYISDNLNETLQNAMK